jgi:hypothetical protein
VKKHKGIPGWKGVEKKIILTVRGGLFFTKVFHENIFGKRRETCIFQRKIRQKVQVSKKPAQKIRKKTCNMTRIKL